MIVKHLLHDVISFVKSYDYIQGLIGDQVERERLLRLTARVGGMERGGGASAPSVPVRALLAKLVTPYRQQ